MAVITGFLKHPVQLISSMVGGAPPVQIPVPGTAAAAGAFIAPPGGSGLPAAQAVSDQLGVPSGVCGWVPTETGGNDWVCQSMGQVMPGIVFVVGSAVILITAFFLIRYLMRSLAAATELAELTRALRDHTPVLPHEWAQREECDQVVAALMRSGKRIPPLAHFAVRVRDSLLPVDAGADHLVLRRSITQLAAEDHTFETWTGRTLADALPNWLTAIGLTTTFIALLLGLQHVKVGANMEVHGIGGLVNGLSGKFFSSIIALGCAVSVSIANHFLGAITGNRWMRVQERLDELMPALTAERVFLEMSRRSAAQDSVNGTTNRQRA